MFIPPSEMILNADGSIYHLKLKPGEVAETIITVGDQDRVGMVAEHLDSVELERQSREFRTMTGELSGKRLTIISTGIGTDNIDIVFNELDALVNVDFETRQVKDKHTRLDFVRIGTSGAISAEVPLDSIIVTEHALGYDGLLHYYDSASDRNSELEAMAATDQRPYGVDADQKLYELFSTLGSGGVTITATGFYGPQSRQLRLKPAIDIVEQFSGKDFKGTPFTNLEMETAGIYGLAKMLGHRAISLNAILANRVTNEFSAVPRETVQTLIENTLNKILDL